MKRLSAATAQQALLILLSLVSLYPIWFTLQTALKSSKSYMVDPTGLPREPTLANFHDLFAVMPFGLWTLNSAIVAFVSVAAATAISVFAAYAIAFGRFPGRLAFFNLKDYRSARDAFEALASHSDPKHPDPQLWYMLGETDRMMGDKKAALTAYKTFLTLMPSGEGATKARGYNKQLTQ